MTLIRECAEELGFAATVVPDDEFIETAKVTDVSIVSIFKKIDNIKNFKSIRKSRDGKDIEQPWITNIFIV